jgi:hypothetical protein
MCFGSERTLVRINSDETEFHSYPFPLRASISLQLQTLGPVVSGPVVEADMHNTLCACRELRLVGWKSAQSICCRSPHAPVDLRPEHPYGVPRSHGFRNSPWKPTQAVDYFYTATAQRSRSVLSPYFYPALVLQTYRRGGVRQGMVGWDQSTFKGTSPIGKDGARWYRNRVLFLIEQKTR